MQKFLIIFFSLFCTAFGYGQNLTGRWLGKLPQEGYSFSFLMEAEIQQSGSRIFGVTKYQNPTTKSDFVIERFSGTVIGTQISINEYEVVEGYVEGNGYGWCIKNLTGKLVVDESNKRMLIVGTWYSKKAWFAGRIQDLTCSPGEFWISMPFEPEVELRGITYNKPDLQGTKSKLTFSSIGSETITVNTDEKGNYDVKLKQNTTYKTSVTAKGYTNLVEEVATENQNLIRNFFLSKELETEKAKPNAVVFEPHKRMILSDVLFEPTSAILLPESFSQLTDLVAYLKTYPRLKVRLEGHTDAIGHSAKNLRLSWDRVTVIKRFLVKSGIKKQRIETIGFGDTRPICTSPCDKNRRVEFLLE